MQNLVYQKLFFADYLLQPNQVWLDKNFFFHFPVHLDSLWPDNVVKLVKPKVQAKQANKVIIAQWLARRLATGEVPGSNPYKGDNLLISD